MQRHTEQQTGHSTRVHQQHQGAPAAQCAAPSSQHHNKGACTAVTEHGTQCTAGSNTQCTTECSTQCTAPEHGAQCAAPRRTNGSTQCATVHNTPCTASTGTEHSTRCTAGNSTQHTVHNAQCAGPKTNRGLVPRLLGHAVFYPPPPPPPPDESPPWSARRRSAGVPRGNVHA